MKITILSILFFLFATSLYAQQQQSNEKVAQSIFKPIKQKQVTTIQMNGSAYSNAVLQQLRADLLSYQDKILKVELNTTSKEMAITYNGFMRMDDFEQIFYKNGVSIYTTKAANATPSQVVKESR